MNKQLHDTLAYQQGHLDEWETFLAENSPSPCDPGVFARWLWAVAKDDKEAITRIAVAVANAGLSRLDRTPENQPLFDGLWAAEQWCQDPGETTLEAVKTSYRLASEALEDQDLDGAFHISELGVTASWAAAADIVIPPESERDFVEGWELKADNCAFEGACYTLLLFHKNSRNAGEAESLKQIIGIVAGELLPWCNGGANPLQSRVAARKT